MNNTERVRNPSLIGERCFYWKTKSAKLLWKKTSARAGPVTSRQFLSCATRATSGTQIFHIYILFLSECKIVRSEFTRTKGTGWKHFLRPGFPATWDKPKRSLRTKIPQGPNVEFLSKMRYFNFFSLLLKCKKTRRQPARIKTTLEIISRNVSL